MSGVDALVDTVVSLERPLLLALDVDGTLSPTVRDPDLAEIPLATLSVLAALAKAPSVKVAFITGRDSNSLSRMEQLEGVWRAVEHGGLVLAPGQTAAARELTITQRAALDRFGGLEGLATATGPALEAMPGLGPAKSASLRAAIELARRMLDEPLERGQLIRSPADVQRHFRGRLRDLRRESFHVLLLDGRHRLITTEVVSLGMPLKVLAEFKDVAFLKTIEKTATQTIVTMEVQSTEVPGCHTCAIEGTTQQCDADNENAPVKGRSLNHSDYY